MITDKLLSNPFLLKQLIKINNSCKQDKIKKYLFDILVSANSIFEYLGEKRNLSKYEDDKLMRRAIEREFEKLVKQQ